MQPQRLLAELAAVIERMTEQEGTFPTVIEGLQLFRASSPSEPVHAMYPPSLCLIAQGSKQIRQAEDLYRYGPARCLLVAVDLPVVSQVVEASPEEPYLSLRLRIDLRQIGSLVTEMGVADTKPQAEAWRQASGRGIFVACVDTALLDAVIRLLRLLEDPKHIPILAPMIHREILYLLLIGEQGAALRRIAQSSSEMAGIVKALQRLKHDFAEPLRIDDLARDVHMSPSRFHLHFKAVTGMSPLQYQKRLRLQEARRLMFGEVVDAATACYRVGYESPSQFSREYRRLFGDSPRRDMARLRNTSQSDSATV